MQGDYSEVDKDGFDLMHHIQEDRHLFWMQRVRWQVYLKRVEI